MSAKRKVLGVLQKAELLEIGRTFDLDVKHRMSVDELLEVVAKSKRATLDAILPSLSRDALKAACEALDLSPRGREKTALVIRILEMVQDRSNGASRLAPNENTTYVNLPTTEDHSRETTDDPEALRSQDTETSDVEEDDEELLVHPYDPSKNNIITKSMSLDLLVKRLERNEIDLMPDFQREGNLWDAQRMSRLVESLLIRLPLPVFYFDATNESQWLVVDGLQRLSTLQQFVVDKSLALTGLEYLSAYEGKTFDALPRDMQRRIEETQIVAHMIQPGTPPEVKYNIFRRINTGGLALTAQEIRHALNPGKVGQFLFKLSRLDSFRAATRGGIKAKRMLDREFALRFLAFSRVSYQAYDGPLDWFLTRQMAELNKVSDHDLERLLSRFDRAMILANELFGEHAFRKRDDKSNRRRPINKALFEAWSVALGALSEEEAPLLSQRLRAVHAGFMRLLADPEFDRAISQGTGDPAKVRKRFGAIEDLVADILRGQDA